MIREGLDLETAKVGVEDRSKFEIHIRAEIPDPDGSGNYIPAPDEPFYFKEKEPEFRATFDFTNPEHIKALNVWRHQVRYRNFAPTRKERSFVSSPFFDSTT